MTWAPRPRSSSPRPRPRSSWARPRRHRAPAGRLPLATPRSPHPPSLSSAPGPPAPERSANGCAAAAARRVLRTLIIVWPMRLLCPRVICGVCCGRRRPRWRRDSDAAAHLLGRELQQHAGDLPRQLRELWLDQCVEQVALQLLDDRLRVLQRERRRRRLRPPHCHRGRRRRHGRRCAYGRLLELRIRCPAGGRARERPRRRCLGERPARVEIKRVAAPQRWHLLQRHRAATGDRVLLLLQLFFLHVLPAGSVLSHG
mmetsp:Transcript_23753/g.69727  ORF Transcript_23753/g.69727 Transcript_23753/m.69727 type:complete len:257 (-) Transcript_23753:26-796(-)